MKASVTKDRCFLKGGSLETTPLIELHGCEYCFICELRVPENRVAGELRAPKIRLAAKRRMPEIRVATERRFREIYLALELRILENRFVISPPVMID